ncbi:MAG TPA: hypothetical protein VMF35_17050 [Acidimicrobiales bacterium]|nr:hypothetical protein [Acidimicrobiales bacterium]
MKRGERARASLRAESCARLAGVLLAVLVVACATAVACTVAGPATAGAATSDAVQGYGAGHLMAADPAGGYWTATPTGAAVAHNGAPQLGSPAASGSRLNQPLVGMAATPDADGYWLVASDGGIFSYGDARFFGSTGSIKLNQPIVGMAPTPDGGGYWLVASDGGIFSYGDARFFGSTGSIKLNQPIVGMAPTRDGGGYWLVASDGGIFSYGDAGFFGSTGSLKLNQPIVGMAATPDGGGYWLVASDGGIFTFGDAPFYGSLGGTGSSALGMVVTPSDGGYSLVTADGVDHAFAPQVPAAPAGGGGQSGGTTTSTSPPSTTTTSTTVPSTTTSTSTTTTTTQPQSGSSAMTTGFYSAAIAGGPSSGDCAPTTSPTATADTSLDSVFANQQGPGWLGGDATYSTALPNGQEAFAFSDTLVGTALASGVASLTGMPHNSELIGTMPSLSGDIGGTDSSPQALIPDADGTGDSWQVAATYMENGQQLIFVNEFAPVAGSLFDAYAGTSGIAVMSLSSGKPTLTSLTFVPTDADTQWGNAMTQSGGYDYIYGMSMNFTTNVFNGMKVARVPVGESLDTNDWTYWNGHNWVAGESNAIAAPGFPLIDGVIPLANGSGYMGVGVGGSAGQTMEVALTFSCSPTGPWSTPQNVYNIPETTEYPDELAYIATFHPELTANGLVASYNINSLDGLAALEANDHIYQPQFIQISG